MIGYKIDIPNRQRYWGARAIFKGYRDDYLIELIANRQSTDGMSDPVSPEDYAFFLWLNERALPWLRKEVKRLALATDEAKDVVFKEFKYELRANTNASCGYLYIGVVEHQRQTTPAEPGRVRAEITGAENTSLLAPHPADLPRPARAARRRATEMQQI